MIQNIALREIANGILLTVDMALTLVFLRYIWYELVKKSKDWRDFRDRRMASLEAQIILSLVVYHFGTTIRNGYNYVTYKLLSAGWESESDFMLQVQSHPVIITALVITMIGALCALRVFSKHKLTWFYVLAAAVTGPLILYYYFKV